MEILVIWLLCAIAAAAIAGGKGRSVLGWLLLGLLLGIFAVIIVACLPSRKAPPTYKVVHADGTMSLMEPVPDRPAIDMVAVAITLAIVVSAAIILQSLVSLGG